MSVKLPSIPTAGFDNPFKSLFDKIKIIIDTREGLRGTAEDKSMTGQDLIDLGLVTKADLEKMLRKR